MKAPAPDDDDDYDPDHDSDHNDRLLAELDAELKEAEAALRVAKARKALATRSPSSFPAKPPLPAEPENLDVDILDAMPPGKTREVLADRARRFDDLVAPGETVEMIYPSGVRTLSLRSAKLFYQLIDAAGDKACEPVTHSIPIASMNAAKLPIEEFIDDVRELFRVEVRLEATGPRGRYLKMGPLLADVERDYDRSGHIRFELSPVLRRVLEKSNHWAILSRAAVMAFESRYALRLYEIISLRARLATKVSETFEIDELRRRFGVPSGKLTNWSDLRRKVINPALAEVNHLSGFTVSAMPIKRSRAVEAVEFTWQQRDPSGREAVARELANVRTGRKARREGTVEEIFDPEHAAILADMGDLQGFPRAGSIIGTHWAEIAKTALGDRGREADVDSAAVAFRKFANREKAPLQDHVWAKKAFATFCTTHKPSPSRGAQ
jgi:hypothetical protein